MTSEITNQPRRLQLLDLPVEILEQIIINTQRTKIQEDSIYARPPTLRKTYRPATVCGNASPYTGLPRRRPDEEQLDAYIENASLQYASLSALRITCRTLHEVIRNGPNLTPPAPKLRVRTSLLHRLEEWDCYSVPLPQILLKNRARDRRQKSPSPSSPARASLVGEAQPFWVSKIAPVSRHTCDSCERLKPSSAFALSQVTNQRAKRRDTEGMVAISAQSRKANPRRCIECARAKGITKSEISVKFVEHWETEPVIGTGFVCSRWNCRDFVRVVVGQNDEDVEGGLQSPEYLRRTCSQCLEYRKPGGDYTPARGHVMT